MTGANAKIKKIYVGTNLVRPKPQDITETYNISSSDTNIYKSGYVVKSVVVELDYYTPSSGSTGCAIRVWGGTDTNIGYYIWGGSSISSYSSSDGKVEGKINGSGYSTLYSIPNKKIPGSGTYHIKATFTREKTEFFVGGIADGSYTYSGSRATTANSIMDANNTLLACYASSGGASVSNRVAVVTYTPA